MQGLYNKTSRFFCTFRSSKKVSFSKFIRKTSKLTTYKIDSILSTYFRYRFICLSLSYSIGNRIC